MYCSLGVVDARIDFQQVPQNSDLKLKVISSVLCSGGLSFFFFSFFAMALFLVRGR